jgi:hypothetical protein
MDIPIGIQKTSQGTYYLKLKTVLMLPPCGVAALAFSCPQLLCLTPPAASMRSQLQKEKVAYSLIGCSPHFLRPASAANSLHEKLQPVTEKPCSATGAVVDASTVSVVESERTISDGLLCSSRTRTLCIGNPHATQPDREEDAQPRMQAAPAHGLEVTTRPSQPRMCDLSNHNRPP